MAKKPSQRRPQRRKNGGRDSDHFRRKGMKADAMRSAATRHGERDVDFGRAS